MVTKLIGTNGKYNYSAWRQLADNHRERCFAEARRLSLQGGVGGDVGLCLHNALLSEGTGRGWACQVTDWPALKRANWLVTEHAWYGTRLLSAVYSRAQWGAFNFGAAEC